MKWHARQWPVLVVAAAAFLYVNLFVLPATPFLLAGDQTYFWSFAQRMLAGEHVYRDFLQYTPPGTDVVYRAALGLFGLRIWLPNAMDLMLGLAFTGICFALARRIMDRNRALLATGLFLAWIFGKALNGTHHWWSVLVILSALVFARRSSIAAGALFGLASFFTQTHGVFAAAGYAAFLVWDARRTHRGWRATIRDIGACAASFVVVWAALDAPYIASIGLSRLWYFEITFSANYIAGHQHLSLLGLDPTWHNVPNLAQRALVYAALPLVYAVTVIRCWRTDQRDAMLLALVGSALFVEVVLSPNWVRLYAISAPGVILLVWMLSRRLLACAWVVVAILAVQQTIGRQRAPRMIVDLPSRRVAALPIDATKLLWLKQHTQPGDYFFQATWPAYYLPLQLRNPAYLSEITEDESTRPEYIARSIHELDAKPVRYVLWSSYNDQPDPRHPLEDNLGALRAYLHDRYSRVQVFADGDEIWERRDN